MTQKLTVKKDKERHDLLGLRYPSQGCQHFDSISLSTLEKLIEEGYADTQGQQNSAPSIGEFLVFMKGCRKDTVTCHGYLITNDMEDRRVSIEGLSLCHFTTEKERRDFLMFNRHADELSDFRSWWD